MQMPHHAASAHRRGWNVTLVNNLGVVKQPSTAAVIDPTQAVNVTIAATPAAIHGAWVWGKPVAGLPLTLTVAAGDVMVVGVEVGS